MTADTAKWPQIRNYWLKFDDFCVFPQVLKRKKHIKATKNDTGPLSNKQVQYGVQHGHHRLHIPNFSSFKCNALCVYS